MSDIFNGLRPIDNSITDIRGITDFTNLAQFNRFEGGYSVLSVITIPNMLAKLEQYSDLIKTYVKVLEYEFRGISGIESITADVGEFSNGLSTISMINKVTQQSSGTFTMNYSEKAGAVITRTHELFLTGIKDGRSGFKHYHGLIQNGTLKPNFKNEVFSFMYMVTDNTGIGLEKAFYIIGAQPTTADLSTLYNTEKGSYDFKEISCEFRGFPITGKAINEKAKALLGYLTGYTMSTDGSITKYSGGKSSNPILFDSYENDSSYYMIKNKPNNAEGGGVLGLGSGIGTSIDRGIV